MQYTVWSHGRLIGETDLGFVRVFKQSRFGWFYPNAVGEQLMPVVTAASTAMRAYARRKSVDLADLSSLDPALIGVTLMADVAEAFQHLESLAFEVRRDDGSIVPASDVSLRDYGEYLAPDWLAENDDDDLELELELEGESFDVNLLDCEFGESADGDWDPTESSWTDLLDEPYVEWTPDSASTHALGRYQIYVRLIDDGAIP